MARDSRFCSDPSLARQLRKVIAHRPVGVGSPDAHQPIEPFAVSPDLQLRLCHFETRLLIASLLIG